MLRMEQSVEMRETTTMHDSEQLDHSETVERLHRFGVNPLSHRIAIYRYLLDSTSHPTAQDVYADLRRTLPSLSHTTVYNVLKYLCKKGAIRTVSIEHHELRYDAEILDHIHFKCRACSRVFNLTGTQFPTIVPPEGCEVDSVQVHIEGICPSCMKHKT